MRSDDPAQHIDLYAQDPMYKNVDKEFLLSLHIAPVPDPVGQRLMNRHTFGLIAGATLDGDIMDQCRHLQPKLWVGCSIDSLIHQTKMPTMAERMARHM